MSGSAETSGACSTPKRIDVASSFFCRVSFMVKNYRGCRKSTVSPQGHRQVPRHHRRCSRDAVTPGMSQKK